VNLRTARAVLAKGIELPYVERGDADGLAVVCLHAYADSWRSFEPMLDHLPQSLRTLVPTQRGHGDAEKLPSGYGVGDFASDLAGFMDAVGVAAAILVASSSATFTVQRVAAEHPERVLGLVLIGVPWSLAEKRGGPLESTIAGLQDPVDPHFVREFVESTTSVPLREDRLDTLVAESCKVPAHVWKETLAALLDEVPASQSTRLSAPTLILWGDRDAYVSREEQDKLVAAIPGSRLVVYEGAGHVLHWEQPERVARDIAAFAVELER
jgi:pimeloyl-ACP methyl ester carboxylesterase